MSLKNVSYPGLYLRVLSGLYFTAHIIMMCEYEYNLPNG